MPFLKTIANSKSFFGAASRAFRLNPSGNMHNQIMKLPDLQVIEALSMVLERLSRLSSKSSYTMFIQGTQKCGGWWRAANSNLTSFFCSLFFLLLSLLLFLFFLSRFSTHIERMVSCTQQRSGRRGQFFGDERQCHCQTSGDQAQWPTRERQRWIGQHQQPPSIGTRTRGESDSSKKSRKKKKQREEEETRTFPSASALRQP